MPNFNNIAGYSHIKSNLENVRNHLLNRDQYAQAGIHIPHGVLLYGETGVGKTMLAKAVAQEPLHKVELCAGDCISDNPSSRITQVFDEARKNAPCVLIIDELDKIAESKREYYMEGNDKVMKTLLQELDGQKDNSGVLVIATCNSIAYFNPALLRSGRFDRIIEVPKPSKEDRLSIIQYYFNKIKLQKNISEEYLSSMTVGYTGAQIESIINEAGLLAIEAHSDTIELCHLQSAINREFFKALEDDPSKDETRKIVAYHEAGHALASLSLCPDNLQSASIVSQGKTKGYVRVRFQKEQDELMSVKDLENSAIVALAGPAAVEFALQTKYLGGEDDIQKAFMNITNLLTRIGAYGFEYVTQQYGMQGEESDEKMKLISNKRTELLNHFQEIANNILSSNEKAFYAIADALYEKYALTKEELLQLYQENQEAMAS